MSNDLAKLEIQTLNQAKQACMNAVIRGLAHQKWVSDGLVWHDKNHGSLEPDEFGPGIAFYSSLGWLVREGLHEKVFTPRNTEIGLLTWSYQGVIQNSHPELSRWHSKYVLRLVEVHHQGPVWAVRHTRPDLFIQFLHELWNTYVAGRREPQKLFASMQSLVSTHGLSWPEDVLLPPVFHPPLSPHFSKYMWATQ